MPITGTDISKSAITIIGTLIVISLGWLTSTVITLDKSHALTELKVQHLQTSLDLATAEMKLAQNKIENFVVEARLGKQENEKAIQDLDALIKQVGSNLEDKINSIK